VQTASTCNFSPRRRVEAYVTETHQGIEVRCPEHGHLLGIFVLPQVLEIKCHDEYVLVAFETAAEPPVSRR
jgi:hypothetical protein